MNRHLFLCLVLLGTQLLRAQAAPALPAIKFPTGDAAWNVEITYHTQESLANQASPTAVKPLSIQIIRTGNLLNYRTTWSNQKTTETWITKKYILWTDPISGAQHCGPNSEILGYTHYDQSLFDWVQASEIVESTSFQGTSCVLVRKPIAATSPSEPKSPSSSYMQAWIDPKAHLPLAFDNGAAQYAFSFQAPPTTMLVLPKEYQDYLVLYERALTAPKFLGNPRPPFN